MVLSDDPVQVMNIVVHSKFKVKKSSHKLLTAQASSNV